MAKLPKMTVVVLPPEASVIVFPLDGTCVYTRPVSDKWLPPHDREPELPAKKIHEIGPKGRLPG